MEIDRLRQAGSEIGQALMEGYRDQQGVHVETIVGAAAALAGEFALRATEAPLPAGPGWISGGAAEPLLYSAGDDKVTMWSLLKLAATDAGVTGADIPDITEIVSRTTDAIGKSPFPPLSVPLAHFPKEWSPSAGPRFRGAVYGIAEKYKLAPADTALALAFTIMMLINQTKHLVPAKVTVRLAAEIMIGVSRMAPVGDSSTSH